MRKRLGAIAFALMMLASNACMLPSAAAQVFDGPGLQGGVNTAAAVNGPSRQPLRVIILQALGYVLDFLALIAVIMIIVAGFFLVFSMGNEEAMTKAKTLIKYVIIGLIVILFARFIVSFFTVVAPQIVG